MRRGGQELRWGLIAVVIGGIVAIGLAVGVLDNPSDEVDPSELFSGEEAEVAEAIAAAVATRSADDCTRLATGAHLQQREHGAASAALEECTDGVFDRDRGLLDGPVEVTTVEVDGREASAGVVFQGERNPGLSAELALVDDGGWKLDRIDDYLGADRSELERAFRTEILGARVSFPKPAAECAVGRLSALGDTEWSGSCSPAPARPSMRP